MGFAVAKISIQSKGTAQFDKQTRFALASALTLTAREAQTQIIKDIRGSFQIRNNWVEPRSALGVRVKPATKQNLVTIVGTAADFLEKFVRRPAGTVVRLPQGEFLAIPTKNVRRNKRDIIQRGQRPQALRGKRDVVIETESGMVLFQHRGRGRAARLVPLYRLEPQAKIKQKDVLFGPTRRVFEKRFPGNYATQLKKALATARA